MDECKESSSLGQTESSNDVVQCNCCPYGHHIHVDFVEFAKEMLGKRKGKEEESESLQVLRLTPSNEMLDALKILNDAILRGRSTRLVTSAMKIILQEWFHVAGSNTANPENVKHYLDFFRGYCKQLLRYIVNIPDEKGNTVMHYAVSFRKFDVVSTLLDSKVCDPNKVNKAGYNCIMLLAIANLTTKREREVAQNLIVLGDLNIKAAQHGQTALMLGASNGRLDTVKLLVESGADMNIQDEDGSTALMCAAEHGHSDIVQYLLAQSCCDPHLTDNEGSTALRVALEAGQKDIGVMLYAHMHFMDHPFHKKPACQYYKGKLSKSRMTL